MSKITDLGVVFTTGKHFIETHETQSGQALKAIFKLKSYVNKFTDFSVPHMLGLFDKLIFPILTSGSEVSGFSKADNIERTHLQFCKHLLGVKVQTQNNFVYGELGRVPLRNHSLVPVIRYWFAVIQLCLRPKFWVMHFLRSYSGRASSKYQVRLRVTQGSFSLLLEFAVSTKPS